MKTIILLHGLRGTHLGLQAVTDALAQAGYHAINTDLPGSGTRAPLKDRTLQGYVKWLHGLIQDLNLPEKPVLIGHSMGSIIVSHHAERYPDESDSHLILMSPVFRDDNARAKSRRIYRSLRQSLRFLPEGARYHLLSSKAVSYGVSRYLTVDKSQQRKIDRLHAEYSGHFASSDSFLSDAEIAMQEQAIVPPGKSVLMIMGEKDRLISYEYVRKIAENTKAQLIKLPNAGHLINYEQPELTAAKIMAFLKDH